MMEDDLLHFPLWSPLQYICLQASQDLFMQVTPLSEKKWILSFQNVYDLYVNNVH